MARLHNFHRIEEIDMPDIRPPVLAGVLFAVVSLAGCGAPAPTIPDPVPYPDVAGPMPGPDTQAPLPATPVGAAAAYEQPRVGGSPETGCLAEVARQSGVPGVSTISVTEGPSGTAVLVKVPGADLPWQCTTDAAGFVTEVFYMGAG